MGLWKEIKNAFIAENTEETTTDTSVKDTQTGARWLSCESQETMWQLNLAFIVVKNILSTFLANCDWNTYRGGGEIVKGEEWYRLNIAPNRKETSSEFFFKLADKLVEDGEALIIETATKEFFIADSFTFKGGEELLMKDNTFVNVTVGTTTLNRSFKENDSAMYIKTPNYDNVDEAVFNAMGGDFLELKNLVKKGAKKALGMKLALSLGAQAKNKYDEQYIRAMQKVYNPLMEAENAVFVTYKGEALSDLTEKQRGSEVQQVLDAVKNNVAINQEILTNIGVAFGIPKKFMTGDYTEDNDGIYQMAMTMCGKTYLTLLSKKFTMFMLTKDDIIKGAKIKANISSIKYVDKLTMATAVDKLIGSGAYSPNEVREMLDDDAYEDGDTRYITKNYAVVSEYAKGGNTS